MKVRASLLLLVCPAESLLVQLRSVDVVQLDLGHDLLEVQLEGEERWVLTSARHLPAGLLVPRWGLW